MNNPYLPKEYKITEYFRESPDTFTITVNMKIQHEPGQFVQVSLPGIGESPISICSDSRKYIKLNIREVGNVTKALGKLKKGSKLLIRGPYGKGYPMKKLTGNDIIIIGGGCGVAPLKGVIDYVENHKKLYKDLHLFLGYRSEQHILFRREMEGWKDDHYLTVNIDEASNSKLCYDAKTGYVTNSLAESNLDNKNKVVFICGPPIMIKGTIKILKERGFNDDQIFISAERLMYCAVGACCHCMIKGKYTCTDGPVFRYDDLKEITDD